jgi:hypothetical protein
VWPTSLAFVLRLSRARASTITLRVYEEGVRQDPTPSLGAETSHYQGLVRGMSGLLPSKNPGRTEKK